VAVTPGLSTVQDTPVPLSSWLCAMPKSHQPWPRRKTRSPARAGRRRWHHLQDATITALDHRRHEQPREVRQQYVTERRAYKVTYCCQRSGWGRGRGRRRRGPQDGRRRGRGRGCVRARPRATRTRARPFTPRRACRPRRPRPRPRPRPRGPAQALAQRHRAEPQHELGRAVPREEQAPQRGP
jgi:hypothetical protein